MFKYVSIEQQQYFFEKKYQKSEHKFNLTQL